MKLFGSWRIAWAAGAVLWLAGCGLGSGARAPGVEVALGPHGLAVPPGRAAAIWARVENRGPYAVRAVLRLRLPAGAKRVSGPATRTLTLAPGARRVLRWAIAPHRRGRVPIGLEARTASGTRATTLELAAVPGLRVPKRFLLSAFTPPYAWRDPPYRDADFRYYREAGFRHMLWARDEDALIERIHAFGLRYFLDVADLIGEGVYLRSDSGRTAPPIPPERLQRLDDAVRRRREDPFLNGYYIVDEPYPGAFANVGQVIERLHLEDPGRPTFIDAFPYFAPDEGSPAYLESLLTTTGVDWLCTDRYVLFNDHDEPEAFRTELGLIRRFARRFGVPFCAILQAVGTNGTRRADLDWRTPTPADLRWQAYTALAYGAKGLVWFHWDLDWGVTGSPDRERIYSALKELNPRLRAVGEALLPLRNLRVYREGEAGPLVPEEGRFVIGLFAGPGSFSYALLANQDRSRAVSVPVRAAAPLAVLERFDPARGSWRAVPLDATRFRLRFPAGGAALLRYRPAP